MRVAVDVTMRTSSGRAASGVDFYVYERGTTDEVDVYDAETGGSVVAQPLTTNGEGRVVDHWVGPGIYDIHTPSDSVDGTQPWDAGMKALSGLIAARPTAAAVNSGLLYYASDDNGGTLYLSDGSDWDVIAPRSSELLSLERTTAVVTSTTGTGDAVTGLNGTVVSRGRPLEVRASCALPSNNASGGGGQIFIFEDIGDTGTLVQVGQGSGGLTYGTWLAATHAFRRRPAQAAGTVIRYEVRVAAIVGGTATFYADAAYPIALQVNEI